MLQSSSLLSGHAPKGRRFTADLLRALPPQERSDLYAYGLKALEATQSLLQQGKTVISEIIGNAAYVEWEHYPQRDAKSRTGALFYYHAHAASQRMSAEHGHFHVFAPNDRAECPSDQRYTHIAGLSVDARGMPLRVFTTNQWVTAECWEDAERVCTLARQTTLKDAKPHRVGQWLDAVFAFFRPQIDLIAHMRDARVKALQARGRTQLLEDRRTHILSQCRIDFSTQIFALEELGGDAP
ncbi:MAG: hypothetical protein J0I24_10460 [Thiomonas arsenitoxydans]|uniref:DUF6969 domain-containing protein n=1 Tax=Thiomonas arsenitoxydans (strain DSM 22701 / CIP 110005 / 3As) TaxID=426114 RepID=A0A8I1SXK5_THIA3|nr:MULTISPECIES: hypothetical protein [Thiomonas]MBN8744714.1 hypothetical protein [Thiomonas arsenitoxydans]ODU93668.1 MAG: hypothetical protein ABT24_13180 [Thiomonas sp. SCN 64-16]